MISRQKGNKYSFGFSLSCFFSGFLNSASFTYFFFFLDLHQKHWKFKNPFNMVPLYIKPIQKDNQKKIQHFKIKNVNN